MFALVNKQRGIKKELINDVNRIINNMFNTVPCLIKR